jgi:hypothetical protein
MTEIAIGIPPATANGAAVTGAAVSAATMASEVRDAFLLGATISELQGRVRVAVLDPRLGAAPAVDGPSNSARESFVPYVEADSNIAWTTSAWRVLFDRLSLLHARFFVDSTTRNTHYDPGDRMPPYFFPHDEPDYAQIGIAPRVSGKEVLPGFSLCEATRRGLNCLTLLCIHPEVSLMPQTIEAQQARLLAQMPERVTGDDGGRDAAISITVQQILQFLHAWEGFLRESFFTAGVTARNENNLIAFEAGLSMAWLSWGISVQALSHPPDESAEARQQRLRTLWSDTFADSGMSRLQHQVTIVGKALDDASAAASGTSSEESRAATQAVKRSLEYWQRSVKWLLKRTDPGAPEADPSRRVEPLVAETWDQLRLALIAQTGIWQALVLGQQQLDSYTAEGVVQRIMQDVAVKFQQLAAGRGLFGAAEQVSQTVVKEIQVATDQVRAIATTAEEAIGKQLQQALGTLVRSFWPVIAVLGVITLLGLFVLIQHATSGQTSTWLVDLTTPLLGIASALGLISARDKIASNATAARLAVPATSAATAAEVVTTQTVTADAAPGGVDVGALAGRVGAFAGQIGSEILADFERGFARVQEDLQVLGHSVGVSYPLVEYFVLNEAWKDIAADVDFMDRVVWDETDRHAEIVRVASAAFGPMGVFAIAAATPTPTAPAAP